MFSTADAMHANDPNVDHDRSWHLPGEKASRMAPGRIREEDPLVRWGSRDTYNTRCKTQSRKAARPNSLGVYLLKYTPHTPPPLHVVSFSCFGVQPFRSTTGVRPTFGAFGTDPSRSREGPEDEAAEKGRKGGVGVRRGRKKGCGTSRDSRDYHPPHPKRWRSWKRELPRWLWRNDTCTFFGGLKLKLLRLEMETGPVMHLGCLLLRYDPNIPKPVSKHVKQITSLRHPFDQEERHTCVH